MPSSPFFFRGSAMIMAATMGVGIFSLPYVIKEAGWLTSLVYFVGMTAIIIQVHSWYWRTLQGGERQRLLGLIGQHGGRGLFIVAFLSIVVGLLLVLSAYLSLAGSFFSLLFPGQSRMVGVVVVWALGSLPLLFGLRRMVSLEFFGVAAVLSILVGLFFLALTRGNSFPILSATTSQFLLPFGPLLFSLAGWTAIEPTYDSESRKKLGSSRLQSGEAGDGFRGVAWGTVLSAFFYIIFVFSIFLLTSEISPDTASGLVFWPTWERALLSFFGLLLIVKSFVLIAWEIHTSLERDLHSGTWSLLVPVCIPILLFLCGFDSFLLAVSLAGGLFLSLQYLGVIFVASRVLTFSRREKVAASLISLVFFLAALYEVFTFFLK